jgi:signal transduction histidine kinase
MTNALKKVTIGIPPRLFELGLTEAQVHGLSHRWFVISLYRQGKISATEAGTLLSTDRDGFLLMLDKLGVLYDDAPDNEPVPARRSPQLAELARMQHRLETLTEELAKTQFELHRVREQYERADKARSEFIATVSHELRTPLNSILGFAKLLRNQKVGPLNEIQLQDLSLIYDSAQHLLDLVNNILDYSKIEAGKIRLDTDWKTVEEIIVGVIASTYILIANKPVKLVEKIEPNLPKLYVDRNRIRQVVINLLANAVKFTDAGRIVLNIYRLTENEQEYVCFAVSDTGIGISKDDIDNVFEPFQQADEARTRQVDGSGLGIPISYRLVKLHGGRLWVESKIGQGSTFFFTIPVDPPKTLKSNVVDMDYRLS